MAGITIAQAGDLLTTTLARMPRGQFTNTIKHQYYALCERLFGDGKIRAKGGTRFEKRIRLRENESARGLRLFQSVSRTVVDVMSRLAAEWCHAEGSASWDVRELMMNESDAEDQIIELIETRRQGAYESLANFFEDRGFLTPGSATDDLNPLGVAYWVRPLGTGVTDPIGGHNGTTAVFQDATTSALIGGQDATLAENSRLRNWAATVPTGEITPATMDLIRVACRRTNFRNPAGFRLRENRRVARKRCIYWSQDQADQYARLVNLGPDDRNGNLSPYSGDLPFMDCDTAGASALDNVANSPIYGVNHNHLYVVALKGAWMQEDKPVRDRDQRHVYTMGIDSSYQIFCDNPRAMWVIHTPR